MSAPNKPTGPLTPDSFKREVPLFLSPSKRRALTGLGATMIIAGLIVDRRRFRR